VKKKIIIIGGIIFIAMFLFSIPAFAVTETEVQARVAETSKEAVSGNIFIWFLCAIAFLKVSQKIDSFMSSLGINVGHTGGNMLAEALIAVRGAQMGKQFTGGGGFGRGSSGSGSSGSSSSGSGGGTRFLSGGLAGAVSRQFNKSAVSSATNQGGNAVTRNAFQSSMVKGGSFANNIISSVAKGDINQMGSITGPTASMALTSYMGYAGNGSGLSNSGGDIAGGVIPPETGVDFNGGNNPFKSGAGTTGGNIPASTDLSWSEIPDGQQAGINGGIPSFSDVEIGGGRIMGTETTADYPDGIQFGMYNTEQYMAPEKGDFETVTTADGAKWYKQYAMDTVEKTPYETGEGKIAYNEAIVQKLPPIPRRKDRV